MKYITHRRYKKTGASGKEYNFARETKLDTIGEFIAFGNEAVCNIRSQDAYEYFSRNDDDKGLERGKLTYEIAFLKRKPNEDNEYRFTPEEIEMLEDKYSHWLRQDSDTILFNYDFFNAEVDELKKLHKRLY